MLGIFSWAYWLFIFFCELSLQILCPLKKGGKGVISTSAINVFQTCSLMLVTLRAKLSQPRTEAETD